MEGYVRPAPGIACGRKIIGVDLAIDLEYSDPDGVGQRRPPGEPFGIGPGPEDPVSAGNRPGQRRNLIKCVVDENSPRERCDCFIFQCADSKSADQRLDVVPPQHVAENPHGFRWRDERAVHFTGQDPAEERGLDARSRIYTR